jgi:hypothetical protein
VGAGKLQSSATLLSGKEPLVTIGREAEWSPETMFVYCPIAKQQFHPPVSRYLPSSRPIRHNVNLSSTDVAIGPFETSVPRKVLSLFSQARVKQIRLFFAV